MIHFLGILLNGLLLTKGLSLTDCVTRVLITLTYFIMSKIIEDLKSCETLQNIPPALGFFLKHHSKTIYEKIVLMQLGSF